MPNADYRNCETVCPLTCGEPVPSFCAKMCGSGCACPPGYVRGSSGKFECVSIKECPPTCQPNSTFEICKYGCEPRCFKPPPKDTCVPRCHTGDCVCNKGFAAVSFLGRDVCVPWEQCPKKTILARLIPNC
uniref:TIL domain containing protein n=1 Tax=Rhipicephalus zambeziensis TaxID=60191 RepID=A0A224YRA4_9ACAR